MGCIKSKDNSYPDTPLTSERFACSMTTDNYGKKNHKRILRQKHNYCFEDDMVVHHNRNPFPAKRFGGKMIPQNISPTIQQNRSTTHHVITDRVIYGTQQSLMSSRVICDTPQHLMNYGNGGTRGINETVSRRVEEDDVVSHRVGVELVDSGNRENDIDYQKQSKITQSHTTLSPRVKIKSSCDKPESKTITKRIQIESSVDQPESDEILNARITYPRASRNLGLHYCAGCCERFEVIANKNGFCDNCLNNFC